MEINNKHRSCIIFPLKDSGSLTSYRESHNHHHHSPHKQELPNSINSIKHCHGNPTSIVFPCYRQDEKIYSPPKQTHLKNAISETQPFLTIGDAFTLRVCQVGPAYATSQLCCSHIYPCSWFSPWFQPESRPVALIFGLTSDPTNCNSLAGQSLDGVWCQLFSPNPILILLS